MGFFQKIKQNFKHGGVKITLQAPGSVSVSDAALPVTVTLVATDSAQTIKSVRAEIIAESRDRAFDTSGVNGTNRPTSTYRVVARTELAEPFMMQAGETRTVQVNIVMNQLANGDQFGAAGGAIGETLQKLITTVNALDSASYIYMVKAVADVDGIALDPSDSRPLQVLRPGEIGGAFALKI